MTKTVDRSYDSYYSVSSMYAYNYRILYMSCICTYLSCVSKRAATSSLISLLHDRGPSAGKLKPVERKKSGSVASHLGSQKVEMFHL